MSKPVLVVGYTPSLMQDFGRFLPDDSVVVLEEPDPVRKYGARAVTDGASVCRELIEEEFLRPGGADKFYLENRDLDPIAVIPAHDYAVPAAARLAERYGVLGAGFGAAQILRDKHLTRVVAAAAGIGNPASRPVSSAAEVAAFQRETGGTVIIKPANRQATIGTIVVTDPAEIPVIWEQCLQQDGENCLPDRGEELRMLVEQFVTGPEFSVELLYSNGKRVFANVTDKVLYPGPRPVELGHLVPAPVSEELTELLISETERLLETIGFGSGLVCCEWIVADGKPYLVECAGRQPGDFLLELIQEAYEFDVFRAYVEVMTGAWPQVPESAPRGAATWHGSATPGEVVAIEGLAEAAALTGVKTCKATVKLGATVQPLRSSWDRTAVVTAHADTALEAQKTAQRAIELIHVETEPVPDAGEKSHGYR